MEGEASRDKDSKGRQEMVHSTTTTTTTTMEEGLSNNNPVHLFHLRVAPGKISEPGIVQL